MGQFDSWQPSPADANEGLGGGASPAVLAAGASQCSASTFSDVCVLDMSLALIQAVASSDPSFAVQLFTASVLGPCWTQYAGVWGLARSVRVEALLPLQCLEGETLPAVGMSIEESESALHLGAARVPRLCAALQPSFVLAMLAPCAHLVTGGTGGLGLLTARWLAQCGACALVLVARKGALLSEAGPAWHQMQATSTSTLLQRCDTAETAHVQHLAALL